MLFSRFPVAAASIACIAAAAVAQPAPDASFVVVVQNDAPLRSGDSGYNYPVAALKAGTVLRTDGESGQWLRVAYPTGMRAFLRADEASADAAGKTARLIKPSRLQAPNATGGDRGSFQSLLNAELAPGTELEILETFKNDDGKPRAYAVPAPASARGYIAKDATRRATQQEIDAGRSAAGGAAPAPAPVPVQPPKDSPKAPAPQPQPSTPGPGPGTTPPSEPSTVTVPGQPAPGPAAAPGNDGQPPAPAPAPVEPPKPSQSELLMAMFERVRAQPLMDAEIEPALAEFDKYLGTLSDSDADQAIKKNLSRFVAVLKLRKDVRENYRANEAAVASMKGRESEAGKQVAEMEKQRVYTVIGRLVSSTVYDGQRLPLLYRLQSPEPVMARTIGYLQPDPKMDLSGKVGQVVGVIGDGRFDESLKANIYTVRRVDVVSLAPVGQAPAAAPLPLAKPVAPAAEPPAATAPEPKPDPKPATPAIEVRPPAPVPPADPSAPAPMQMKPVEPKREPEKP